MKRLKDLWDVIPITNHVLKTLDANGIPTVEICGKKFNWHVPVKSVIESLDIIMNNYGQRVFLARENSGIDWKSVHHAFRVAYELEELWTTGKITFPLPKAQYLKDIKQGKYSYSDIEQPLVELIEKVTNIAETSSVLPNNPNRKFWDDWILTLYKNQEHVIVTK